MIFFTKIVSPGIFLSIKTGGLSRDKYAPADALRLHLNPSFLNFLDVGPQIPIFLTKIGGKQQGAARRHTSMPPDALRLHPRPSLFSKFSSGGPQDPYFSQ